MQNQWNLAPSSSRSRRVRVVATFLLVVGALLVLAQSSKGELELLEDQPSERPALRRAQQALQRLGKASRALKGQNYGAARVHLEAARRALAEVIADDADEVLRGQPAVSEPAGATPPAPPSAQPPAARYRERD